MHDCIQYLILKCKLQLWYKYVQLQVLSRVWIDDICFLLNVHFDVYILCMRIKQVDLVSCVSSREIMRCEPERGLLQPVPIGVVLHTCPSRKGPVPIRGRDTSTAAPPLDASFAYQKGILQSPANPSPVQRASPQARKRI